MWYEDIKKKEIGYHVKKNGVHFFLDNNANEITRTYWPDVPASKHSHRCNYLNKVTVSYQNKQLILILISTLYCVEFTTKGLLYLKDVCRMNDNGYLTKDSFDYIFVDYEDE